MSTATLPQTEGEAIDPRMFGGNFLADRYELGPGGQVEGLIDQLGINGLRYPGGSLTERLFDIRNPDAARVTEENGVTKDFVPLSDFMAYAESAGQPVTIVIPTRDNLSNQTDAQGDRFPAFSESDLRTFVRDLVTGQYGNAEIAAIEIGNEYWGSGEMTAVEYGRLGSRMAQVIGEELDAVTAQTGDGAEISVLVQSGSNSGSSNLSREYSSFSNQDALDDLNARFGTDFGDEMVFWGGRINWRGINDELILREFNDAESSHVDGVVTHLYSKESVSPGQRDFGLNQVNRFWGDDFPDIDIHVTEWNQSASDTRLKSKDDFGLEQAHEVLNVFESMVAAGVDEAHIWPLIQNTRNALSPDALDGGVSPTGQLFTLMADALPGKTMLDFDTGDERVTELQGADADLHGFYGDGELVFYLASTVETTETLSLDLGAMLNGDATVSARLVGVEDGADPDRTNTEGTLQELPGEDFYDDGTLVATLAAHEILELRITNFRPTNDFARIMDRIDDTGEDDTPAPVTPTVSSFDEDLDLPVVPVDDLPPPPAEDDEDEEVGFFENIGLFLAMLFGGFGF